MNDQQFFKSFAFNEFKRRGFTHVDNSRGIDMHYIGYMKKGSAYIVTADTRIDIGVGDMFYIPKGCRYHSYWSDPEYVLFDSIGFEYFPKREVSYRLQLLSPCGEAIEIYRALSSSLEVNALSVGRLYTLLGLLEGDMEADQSFAKSKALCRALDILYADPFAKMSSVASQLSVSESTLYNLFKDRMGKTPNRVRQEIVCEKAVQMLKNTNLSVEEISESLYFSSSSYFRKVFFSVTGKTPREVRREEQIV